MIEKLKRIHYMFYASLVFMGFPFISILLGEVLGQGELFISSTG